jgi:hypothetical protein
MATFGAILHPPSSSSILSVSSVFSVVQPTSSRKSRPEPAAIAQHKAPTAKK